MLANTLRPVIMVAGVPRSGTTILAKMLALSPQAGYVEEPFNSQTGMIGTDADFFPIIYQGSKFQTRYDDILRLIQMGRARYKENQLQPPTTNPARLVYRYIFTNRYQIRYSLDSVNPRVKVFILKDPTATLTTEHFQKNDNFSTIYSLRHPCGVVASHQRLGWTGTPIHQILNDRKLYQRMPTAVQAIHNRPLSEVEGLAWYWRAINEYILQVTETHPDLSLIDHETFSRSPINVMSDLYAKFNLDFTPTVRRKIQAHTSSKNTTDPTDNNIHVLHRNSSKNVERWKKLLSPSDRKTILNICDETYHKLQKNEPNLQSQFYYYLHLPRTKS